MEGEGEEEGGRKGGKKGEGLRVREGEEGAPARAGGGWGEGEREKTAKKILRSSTSFQTWRTDAQILMRQRTSRQPAISFSRTFGIRQHTSAYVSMRQHTSAYAAATDSATSSPTEV